MAPSTADGLPRWIGLACVSAALHVVFALALGLWWRDPIPSFLASDRVVSLVMLDSPLILPARAGAPGNPGGSSASGTLARGARSQGATPRLAPAEIAERLAAKAADFARGDDELALKLGGPGGGFGAGRGEGDGAGDGDGGGGSPVLEFVPWPRFPASERSEARTVKVRVLVSPAGTVRFAELENGEKNDAFAAEALEVAARARFKPMALAARSTDVWVSLPISFHPN